MTTPEAGYEGIAQSVAQVNEEANPHRIAGPAGFADRTIEVIGVLLLNAIVLLVLSNAGGRYLFSAPLVWTEEIVSAMLVWLVVIGVHLAVRRGALMASDLVAHRLSQPARRLLTAGFSLIGAACFAWIALMGGRYAMVFGGDMTPYLQIPKGTYLWALPIGCAAMSLASLANAASALRRTAR